MVKFKDFSRPLSVFQVLYKANFIFKNVSTQSRIFKYFSSLYEPCLTSNEDHQLNYEEFKSDDDLENGYHLSIMLS